MHDKKDTCVKCTFKEVMKEEVGTHLDNISNSLKKNPKRMKKPLIIMYVIIGIIIMKFLYSVWFQFR